MVDEAELLVLVNVIITKTIKKKRPKSFMYLFFGICGRCYFNKCQQQKMKNEIENPSDRQNISNSVEENKNIKTVTVSFHKSVNNTFIFLNINKARK